MRTAVITLFALLLAQQTWAEPLQLTLNCHYESAFDVAKKHERPSSGNFSAIVNLDTTKEGAPIAIIRATTRGCFDFVGSFSELEVFGDCERTTGKDALAEKIKAMLKIDRIGGEFEYDLLFGKSFIWYHGHCKSAKKMF